MSYRLPPLNALRLFEAAGRHLSFKLAAEELHLTPSAVSHGIQSLEDWLGVPLFQRAPRGLSLTPAGAAYLPDVRRALDALVAASAALPGRVPDGKLSVSVAPSFGLRWLIPNLPDFNARHPGIAVSVDTAHRQVDFPRDGVDLAIRMGRGGWPGLDAVCLVREKLVPVAAPSVAASIRTPGDLAQQTLLHVASVADDWKSWCELADVALGDRAADPRFDNIQMALEAAAQGLGVAIGRLPLIDGDLASGRLVAVLPPPRVCATGYWLVTMQESQTRPEIAAFRAWIAGRLGVAAVPTAR